MAAQATHATLDQEALQAFAMGVGGPILTPGDAGYDEARALQNGLIDRQPALIVQCTGAADVIAAVNFAREHEPAPLGEGRRAQRRRQRRERRRAGHRPLGDARRARRPAGADVRVQGGATWGDLDRETQVFGLAVPGGVVSTTGIAGLTLHGGMGHLRSKHGLSPRQPALGRHRHRRRPAAHRQRDRERGPLLGGARRRQQLRRHHLVRVPGAPGRPDGDGLRAVLLAGGGQDGAAGVARLHGHGAGRAQLASRSSGACRAPSPSRPSSSASRSCILAAGLCGPVEEGERSCSRCASWPSRCST